MSIITKVVGKVFGGAAAQPIEAIGNVLTGVFGDKGEKMSHQEIMTTLAQRPSMAQVELNKVEASHRSVFVAGWRPFIGWVCGLSLGCYFIPKYILGSYLWVRQCLVTDELVAYPISTEDLMKLVFILLGASGFRTIEKLRGRAK